MRHRWVTSTSSGSSRSASRSRSTRTRRSCAPPPSRASSSCTAARKASARPASRSCSRARTSSSTATRRSRCPTTRRRRAQTLLCRAHAYEDLVIELLNYDEEIIRSGLPLRKGVVEVVANERGDPRHAAPGGPAGRAGGDQVLPGPVHGLHGPGHRRDAVRSRWRTRPTATAATSSSSRSTRTALFSRVPRRRSVQVGDRLEVEAPFGTFTLRESRTSDLIFVGGGAGHGADARRCSGRWPSAGSNGRRPSTTARGRQRDLCFEKELASSRPQAAAASGTSRPCPSPTADDDWTGETGLITDVVTARRVRPERDGCLCLRPAADGGRGDRDC